MAEGPVLVERPGEGIAKLTLNNPPLNLVTLEMTEQLIEALEELEGDEAVRAIVVTGAGDRAFLELSDHVFRTEDCAEGILAFFEKHKPRFAGAPGTGDEVEV